MRGERTRNANAHQHIETPCNKCRGSSARCSFLYVCIYLDILTCAEERKLKTLRIPIEFIGEKKISTEKKSYINRLKATKAYKTK